MEVVVDRLEMFKRHVRADDFSDDDEYLLELLDTAEEHIVTGTHRSREELETMGKGSLPKPLFHAAMMLAAHWYNQREAVSGTQMHEAPQSIQALTKPYRKLS